ncbi:MAG: penicillin acylase family protein [bacterium]
MKSNAILCLFMLAVVPSTFAQLNPPATLTLDAPDGTTVTINRDAYGVPHIVGESEIGVFYGQGFAAAQDRLHQMERNRRAAEGKLSEWFGVFTIELDKQARTLFYTPEERQQVFEALPADMQEMLQAYSDGVNAYLDLMNQDPAQYMPLELKDREMAPWTVYKSIAFIQLLTRRFGQAGGEELDRLLELQENGLDWLNENRPINDPTAPTTIQQGGLAAPRTWHYSGMRVRNEVIRSLVRKRLERQAKIEQLRLPLKLGSFAVLMSTSKSSTGNVMLLGAPQMGPPQPDEPQIAHEVELQCPSFHVGGMTIAGVPMVIIGHTETHAWTLTSGVSDNSDVYIDSTMDASYSKYWHNGQWQDFETIEETISILGLPDQPFTHYRTIHGPVFGDDLDNHQVFSLNMTFWQQELEMIKSIFGFNKAKNLQEFEAAAASNPFSFNLFYADRDQNIHFWHTGKYQDRSDGVDPRLPHKGDGSEEWGGFIPFEELPAADHAEQAYFVNWNNKPVSWWNNGDNVPWHGQTRLTTRVNDMETFVGPIGAFTYDNLEDVPRQINDHGTYQQAIELTADNIIDENIIPPGQSGFIDLSGVVSVHFDDQWPLHVNWQFKDMLFGDFPTEVQTPETLPASFALRQNYPNPFNPTTTISYDLPKSTRVRLQIYNIQGQVVKTLVDEFQKAGSHQIRWEASGLSSGIYVYKLTASGFLEVRKSILVK